MSIEDRYIPDTVVAGKMSNGKGTFLTCKYKREKWVAESVFSRLTSGFKPHLQRDSVKELNKAIKSSTFEFDNVPVKGFKYVGIAFNLYNIAEFNYKQNILLEDPRGFTIAIAVQEFFDLLNYANGNMKGFALENLECAYFWNGWSQRPMLIPACHPDYLKVKAESEKLIGYKDRLKYVVPSKLKIGKAYKEVGAYPRTLVYCGEFDVLSERAMNISVNEQNYDILDLLSKKSNDISGKSKYVFYNLDFKPSSNYGFGNANSPFIIKSSIAKWLECETKYSQSKYTLFDDKSTPCTFENIMSEVKASPMFNKIDFAKSFKTYEKVDKPLFNEFFNNLCTWRSITPDFWPFYTSHHHICMSGKLGNRPVDLNVNGYDCNGNKCLTYTMLKDTKEHQCAWYSYGYSKSDESYECFRDSATAYEKIRPVVPTIYYETGEKMPQKFAIFFLPPNYSLSRAYYGY